MAKPSFEKIIQAFTLLEADGLIIVHKWPTPEDDSFSVTVTEKGKADPDFREEFQLS